MKGFRILGGVIILCALVASVGSAAQERVQSSLFAPEALVLTPPASAAPEGSWSYVASRGYLWMPVTPAGMTEAEWAPWDPWWIMPYGSWTWADGYGWGWTPMIPYHSMSSLGWGFDSWYGGWYGFTPDGNPSNTIWEYGANTTDKERAQAWVNGHGGAYTGHDPDRQAHARVKINTVVAAPPTSLAPPEWKAAHTLDKLQDAQADQGKGFAQGRDRGDRQHGQGAGKNHGKGQGQGKLQGGGGSGHVGPGHGSAPPTGGYGGGIPTGGSSGGSAGQHKKY